MGHPLLPSTRAVVLLVATVLCSLFSGGGQSVPAAPVTTERAPSTLQAALAADARVSVYRAGRIDPRVEQVPASLAAAVQRESERALPQLVAFLVEGTADPFLRAKRLHDWITDNIAYDSDLLLGLSNEGSRKVNMLLKLGRTTCGGFSALFAAMAELAGLEVQTVRGQSRSCWIKKRSRDCGHVWNALRVDGRWYIVDTTADGRRSFKNRTLGPKGSYRDRNLFLHPEAKLLVNFPIDPKQQFVSKPASREELLSVPRVSLAWWAAGLRYRSVSQPFRDGRRDHQGGKIEALFDLLDVPGESVELKMSAADHIVLLARLVPEDKAASAADKARLRQHAFCYHDAGIRCQIRPPAAGSYRVSFLARVSGEERSEQVHSFILRTRAGGGVMPEPDGRIHTNPSFRRRSLKLVEDRLVMRGGFPSLTVAGSPETEVVSTVVDSDGRTVARGVLASYPASDRRTFYYRAVRPGVAFIQLWTRRVPKGPLENLGTASFEAKSPGPEFPPVREVIFRPRFATGGYEVLEDTPGQSLSGARRLTVQGPRAVLCSLQDLKQKRRVELGCVSHRSGQQTTLWFSSPGPGAFVGSVQEYATDPSKQTRGAKSRESLPEILYFRGTPGSAVADYPPANRVLLNARFGAHGLRLVSENFRAANAGEVVLEVAHPAGTALSGRLLGPDRKVTSRRVVREAQGEGRTRLRFPVGEGARIGYVLVSEGGLRKLVAVFRAQ